ncbi:MAG: hypothetical protein AB3X44_04225 [Leptothrix sp. (in: b-proteobacteria)]
MISRLTSAAYQLSRVEGLTKLVLMLMALPAVVLGTLVAATAALVVAPLMAVATSFYTAVHAVGTLGESPFLDLPASFSAGASHFTV